MSANLTEYLCFFSWAGSEVFFAYTAFYVLLLPLFVIVLYMGYQRWTNQRSTSPTSHVDVFTYHMMVLELVSLTGCFCYCFGLYLANDTLSMSGIYCFSMVYPGQSLFHCLTSVERYLAVVHPITYLSLRNPGGVKLRNASIACVWLTCCAWMLISYSHFPDFPLIPFFTLYAVSFLVVCACSVSVLCTLTDPGPGEGSGHRVDQSKQRAFHTIMAIAATLVCRFCGIISCMIVYEYWLTSRVVSCNVIRLMYWFNVPSSLVLPLLFLHRAGKLGCFRFAQRLS